MAEEAGKFNSGGETAGYISLDQARALALQHARDNRELYGRFANREITWWELSADESEDYYRIRLAYHPAGNIRVAGVEQFTIDKTGPIEFRQIISRPRPSRLAAYVLGIAVALAATGAAMGGLFASGALNTSDGRTTSVSITPDSPARLVSPTVA